MAPQASSTRTICALFLAFAVTAGLVAAMAIVCNSPQAVHFGCPFGGNSTLLTSAEAPSNEEEDEMIRTEVILRAVFAGVSVVWLGLVVAICAWYNIGRYRRRYKVSVADQGPTPVVVTVEVGDLKSLQSTAWTGGDTGRDIAGDQTATASLLPTIEQSR